MFATAKTATTITGERTLGSTMRKAPTRSGESGRRFDVSYPTRSLANLSAIHILSNV